MKDVRIVDKSFKVKAQPLIYQCSAPISPPLGVAYLREINFLEENNNTLPTD